MKIAAKTSKKPLDLRVTHTEDVTQKGFVEQFLAFLDTFTLYLLVFLHPFNHNLLLFFNFLLVLASSL